MTGRHLSPLDLDALALASGETSETSALEGHLAGCPACLARKEDRDRRAAAFDRAVLPRLLARLPDPRRPRWWQVAVPALAVLLVGSWWLVRPRPARDERVKGPAALRLVARRGPAIFEVREGAALQPGDGLRFVLPPGWHPWLLIASIDGAGRANVYFPFAGEGSAAVDPARPVEAPAGSVLLDRAPGPERIFALWSAVPLAAAEVRGRLEALGRLGPDAIRLTTRLGIPGTVETSVFFEKEIGRGPP